MARFSDWDSLGLAEQTIASIVDDNVKTTEVLLGRRERSVDLVVVHDVEGQDEQLLGGVFLLQVCENFGFAESRDDPFAGGEDGLGEALAKAGRSAGDWEVTSVSVRDRLELWKHLLNQTLVFSKVMGGQE